MLVLSRRLNEALKIAEEIQVTVLKIRGNRVTLGIQAPDHFNIIRVELDRDQPKPAPSEQPPAR